MAITGSRKEASLTDVIQLLFMGRRTGCLSVADRQRHGSVYFEEGWIIYAAIVNRRDRLGDMLLAEGLVTRAQLDQALALQENAPGRRIGDLLVHLGILAPDALRRFVGSGPILTDDRPLLEYFLSLPDDHRPLDLSTLTAADAPPGK